MDTQAVKILPNWHVYKAITKELKLLRQIPIGENIFIRPTTSVSYDPPYFIKFIWVINYWVIDVETPKIATTPTIVNDEGLTTHPIINDRPTDTPTNVIESEANIDTAVKSL